MTIIEQQQEVTPVEQPKPTEEKKEEEDQTITTTAEVEEQRIPQVTADASSTQPEQEQQVSFICFAVFFSYVCCDYRLKNHILRIVKTKEIIET